MKSVKPFSVVFQILKLFWFFYCFIAISILALPVTLTIQFLAVHSVTTQSRFLPLFARVHHFAKSILYTTIELLKRLFEYTGDLIMSHQLDLKIVCKKINKKITNSNLLIRDIQSRYSQSHHREQPQQHHLGGDLK